MSFWDLKKLLILSDPYSLENEQAVRAISEEFVVLHSGDCGIGLKKGIELHSLMKRDYTSSYEAYFNPDKAFRDSSNIVPITKATLCPPCASPSRVFGPAQNMWKTSIKVS